MGWGEQKLSSLCDMFTDGDWVESKDQSAEGVRLIQTGNVGEGVFKDRRDKSRFISEETFSRLKCTEILEGDCLVSRLPDPVGRSCLIPFTGEKMITAVDCTIIRLNRSHLLPEFFNHFTQSYAYLNVVESLTSGATRKRISRKNLGEVPIPLPPIPEQQRIVAILDQAFADIEKARANAEKNLKNARELFDSYLNQVFSQRGEGWVERPLDSFSNIVNGFSFKSGDFSPSNKVKSIKITNVGVYDFVEESDNYLPQDFLDKYSRYQAYEGDIVVALTRTIISSGLKVAVVPKSYNAALINQRVAAVQVNEEIMPKEMLQAFLSTSMAIDYVKSNVSELMQPNLSIKDLKAFPVPVPPSSKKQVVAKNISNIKLQRDQLVAKYTTKLASLDELKKSLLQKAFSGELTKTEGYAA
jgi:type I restriction enzyme S subunit